MFRSLRPLAVLLSVAGPTLAAGQAMASETGFFDSLEGKWVGPGEIVAGKYKGTKFICVFDGAAPGARPGMSIDGYCRVGMFSQPMNAVIEKTRNGYSGKFLDGEAGEGMDVTGGRYASDKLVVDIKRKDLNGVLVARKAGNDKLQMTISVRVEGKLIPVIGMALDRTDSGPQKLARQ